MEMKAEHDKHDHPLKVKFEIEMKKFQAFTANNLTQNQAIQDSIEKVMNQINFESKNTGRPEDKKFMRFLARSFETIEKTYQELQETMLSKMRNFPKLSQMSQKNDQQLQRVGIDNRTRGRNGKKRA